MSSPLPSPRDPYPAPGSELGAYVELEVLAEEAGYRIYRARHGLLDDVRVLRVLHPLLSADALGAEAFLDRATQLVSAGHRVYDVGRCEAYLISAYPEEPGTWTDLSGRLAQLLASQ